MIPKKGIQRDVKLVYVECGMRKMFSSDNLINSICKITIGWNFWYHSDCKANINTFYTLKGLANNNFIDLIPNFKNISSFIQNFNTKRRRRDKKDLAIIGFVTRNRLFRW